MNTKDTIEIIYWCASFVLLCVTAYYVADAPIKAVKIGRQLNDEQQHHKAKRNLFLTLYGLRGSPVHYDFVMGLNRIDIVFHDNPPVIAAWRNLHRAMKVKIADDPIVQKASEEDWALFRVELLSQMAQVLNYPQIQQVDMLRDYYPVGQENREIDDYKLKRNAIAYLEKGVELYEILIDNANAAKTDEPEPPTS